MLTERTLLPSGAAKAFSKSSGCPKKNFRRCQNSLRRVSLLASDKTHSIKLNFSKNNIDITATTPEVGEAKESIAVAYKGRDFSIAFNPEFLMAPLRAPTEDEVFLDLIDEMSPGVLKIQTPFLYVLMPMRISS